MNVHDSEKIAGILAELGYTCCDSVSDADIVVFNTCCIRETAEKKAYGHIGELKKIKKQRPDMIVAVCGCMSQQNGVAECIRKSYPYVDIVLGTSNLGELKQAVLSARNKRKFVDVEFSKYNEEDFTQSRTSFPNAWVNINYGCNNFCTYCIVPYTRGRERSRDFNNIINEVKTCVNQGFKEITLLGQNVNAYGKDLYEDYTLANLLIDVAKTNIERIRFVTSHPWDFTDEMIEVIAKYPNIMPSIHLPVQSGSDRILKLMGRRYTKEKYLTLFHKMKEMIPNCAISTDIIVGFPGETEEDFEETLNLVLECKYDNAYTFIYSPRVGTPAAKLLDNITKEEKEQRLYKLNDIVNTYFKDNNEKLVGSKVPVLVEGISDKKNEYFGYSDTNKLVNFTGDDVKIGSIVNVEITEAKTWSLDGKVSKQ